MKIKTALAVFACAASFNTAFADNIKVNLTNLLEVSGGKSEGAAAYIAYNDAVAITVGADNRFISGIDIEISAPPLWLAKNGSLAAAIYTLSGKIPAKGSVELDAKQIRMDVLPARIQTVYNIPIKDSSASRTTPYTTVLPVVLQYDFPILLRIMPITKNIDEDIQAMRFKINAKPVLSHTGAVRLNIQYPESIKNNPVTAIIDDRIVEHPQEELVLSEGEHHLVLISNDYRNESRHFLIERGKLIELNISMQDLTPIIIFETPNNAIVFIDNIRIGNAASAKQIEAGSHDIKIQLSDYTIIKSLNIQKGKTYRISFTVDLSVQEED